MYNDPYQPLPPQQGQPQQPPQSPFPSPYDPNYGQYAQQPYGPPPGTQYGVPQGPQGLQAPYGPPPYGMPPGQFMPPQKKSSLTWLWITLGIVGGVLVLGCAACGIFAYTIGKQATTLAGPAFAVGEYYQYLKASDYSKAYTFVDPNASYTIGGQVASVSDEPSFAKTAQSVDATDGPITTIAVSTSSTDTTHITMTITRNGSSYDVHLTLSQEGSTWKIVAADGI